MAHKMSWLIALGITAVAAAGVTRLAGGSSSAPASAAGPVDLDQRLERLERLEANLAERERALAMAGSRVGTAALVGAASALAAADQEGTPEGDAREQRRLQDIEQQEKRHYDRLDGLARSGGGTAAAVQLRKNISALRAASTGSKDSPRVADIGAVDCSDTVCRVEVTLLGRGAVGTTAKALLPGMGGLSMRPLTNNHAVYYLGAPGHDLPPIAP